MSVHALHPDPLVIEYSTDSGGCVDGIDFVHPEAVSTGMSIEALEAENAALKNYITEGRVIAAMMFNQIALLNQWGHEGQEFGDPDISWHHVA